MSALLIRDDRGPGRGAPGRGAPEGSLGHERSRHHAADRARRGERQRRPVDRRLRRRGAGRIRLRIRRDRARADRAPLASAGGQARLPRPESATGSSSRSASACSRRASPRMTWTFDPLQSANAHFNFRKLGVVSDQYKVDFYGDQSSSFLHRNGTDRLWVTWAWPAGACSERAAGASRAAGRRSPTAAAGRRSPRWLARSARTWVQGSPPGRAPDRDPGRHRLPRAREQPERAARVARGHSAGLQRGVGSGLSGRGLRAAPRARTARGRRVRPEPRPNDGGLR